MLGLEDKLAKPVADFTVLDKACGKTAILLVTCVAAMRSFRMRNFNICLRRDRIMIQVKFHYPDVKTAGSKTATCKADL